VSARPSRISSGPRPRRRPPSFDRRSHYLYVRSVRGKTGTYVWQARPFYNAVVGHVNLGCYREERAAWEAVRVWVRAGADPCRGLPPGVLPKWVVRRPQDGRYDAIRRTKGGTRVLVPGGPWSTPEAAFTAALTAVTREAAARRSGSWGSWGVAFGAA
jgi:hypothetical protein